MKYTRILPCLLMLIPALLTSGPLAWESDRDPSWRTPPGVAAVATPPCMRRHAETRKKHREQSRPPLTGREQTRQANLKCCESEEKERQKQRGGNQLPLAEVRSLACRIHCLGL